jgi:predicted Rossmann fold nucleotide-binding protein DprA/Smf involved in DNA uptake
MFIAYSAAISKYGSDAKNGVVLITVNDEKYPGVYKEIKKASKAQH